MRQKCIESAREGEQRSVKVITVKVVEAYWRTGSLKSGKLRRRRRKRKEKRKKQQQQQKSPGTRPEEGGRSGRGCQPVPGLLGNIELLSPGFCWILSFALGSKHIKGLICWWSVALRPQKLSAY